VLALSGGGDSMALACLLADEAARSGRALHTLIVDHRLRAGSGTEAALTASRAEALGATAHILTWADPAPGQAAARTARHQLLARQARSLGADTVFLAHTADDVIETVLMRLSRPSAGWRALAAMPEYGASPAWPDGRGIRLARPLVRTARSDLRRFLSGRGQGWIDDPSNANTAFERVRMRARAPSPQSAAGTALLALNDAAIALDHRVRGAARALISNAADIRPWGGVRLKAAPFANTPREAGLRAVEALVASVSGDARPARPKACAGMLEALLSGRGFTAGGALLTADGVLGRDRGAATGRADGYAGAGRLAIAPGACVVFDGRILVCAGSEALEVGALSGTNPVVDGVPAPLRPSLAVIHGAHGPVIAGLDAVPGGGAAGALIAERLESLLGVSADGTLG
jgi:tRNA(Ile)-lysidine synthase